MFLYCIPGLYCQSVMLPQQLGGTTTRSAAVAGKLVMPWVSIKGMAFLRGFAFYPRKLWYYITEMRCELLPCLQKLLKSDC